MIRLCVTSVPSRSILSLFLCLAIASCASRDQQQAGVASVAHKDLAFTQFFRRNSGWVAGDGAISVPLSDGRVLWLFGDSHMDDLDPATGTMPCLFQTRNAALLQATNDLQNAQTLVGKGPGFRSWLKNSDDDSQWFWPGCGFQAGDTVYVYLNALRKTPTGGAWGFESIGHDWLAKIRFPAMEPIAYIALPSFNGIGFGAGFVLDGSWTYAFGGKQRGIAGDLYVARFASANPAGRWSFWDGVTWNTNPTNTAAIGHGASTSMHVCKVKNKFLLTTSAFSVACDQGKEIYMATSLGPTGPFSPLKKVFTLDDTLKGHYPFFYFPVAHPEFVSPQNELLVTYSINGYEPCVPSCAEGRAVPDHYRPKAIRVPLKAISVY